MEAEFWGDVFVGIHMTTEPLHEAYDTCEVYEHGQSQKIKCHAEMQLLQNTERTVLGP
jgi:hypothetical protein